MCILFTVFCTEAQEVSETADQLALKAKRIYLVDSGLVFNSPYPLLLRPQRDVDVFLSFDFSARDKDDDSPFQVNKLNIEQNNEAKAMHVGFVHIFYQWHATKSLRCHTRNFKYLDFDQTTQVLPGVVILYNAMIWQPE